MPRLTKKRQSYRLSTWNYDWSADYFITICVKNHQCLLGSIKDSKFHYSSIGIIAEILWEKIPIHHPEVSLGEYIIMPNHIHGILHLNNKEDENKILIETDYHSLKHSENWHSKISPPKNSIPSIIRSYKSSVKRYCNRFDLQFEWQKRYYDHIIRDGNDYLRIENYILNNRNKWDEDRFHP